MHQANKAAQPLDKYEEHKEKLKEFIKNFVDPGMVSQETTRDHNKKKYMIKMVHNRLIQQNVANSLTNTIEILVEDLREYFGKEDERDMVKAFTTNTKRYVSLFEQVIHDLMPPRTIDPEGDEKIRDEFENILNNQRRENMEDTEPQNRQEFEKLPLEAMKKFFVSIVYGTDSKEIQHNLSIRELRSELIGSLVICKAIVVRASDVKPHLTMATYSCDACGYEIYQPVLSKEYTPPVNCTSVRCKENKMNGKLTFLTGSSKFVAYQVLKIQETSDQLIEGNIPRTFTVHLTGDLVRQASPGDVVMIQGILLPNRREGFRHAGDIIFDAFLEAYKITREKKKYVDLAITRELQSKIDYERSLTTEDAFYNKLARSIAPEIYGLENVKKALLLLMVGGITKETHDNMKIRGEINIALIGDPGIAKSQLLKHISYISPRGIYTTGKGSSGVGLTAAVVKDPVTNEMSLEAGALVLADMGVCCIDEFDKMDEYDRTAIHEVMEQQTVSIAKAGITTSLNARVSILAAANPLYGRYNKKETPHKNINLPAALLSRFDLIFILQDSPNKARDIQLAKHIGEVHQKKKAPESDCYNAEFLRSYVAMAKSYQPVITEHLFAELTRRYVDKRKEQADLTKEGYSYTTTRTLLGLIRLCQARARLRFSDEVSVEDVQECLDLIEESQASVQTDKDAKPKKQDSTSVIFDIIKSMCKYNENCQADYELVEKRVLARGFTQDQFETTLKSYESNNVLMHLNNRIMIVSGQ